MALASASMSDREAAFLELVILGAGPAYSDLPGSLGSGYLVRTRAAAIALDLGQGCFPGLASRHDPAALDAVFVSHLHPDHYIDLIPLRHFLRRPGAEAPAPLVLHAAAGLAERLDATFDLPGFSAAAFDHRDLVPGSVESPAFHMEVAAVRHSGDSFAFRVARSQGGPGTVYSGDVADIEDIRPLLVDGDLLLVEATLGPGPVPEGIPHLDGVMVGRLAEETSAGQVVVTHVRMGMDLDATLAAVRRSYGGPLSLATPSARYLVAAA